jgi:hypothetical protein
MPTYLVTKNKYIFTEEDKKNKSNEFAPAGYTWIGNTTKIDNDLVNSYKAEGCILQDTAYSKRGMFLEDHYALYKKL